MRKLRTLFAREVSIRLAEDGMNFICTTQYGKFYTKTTHIPLQVKRASEPIAEKFLFSGRKRLSSWASSEDWTSTQEE